MTWSETCSHAEVAPFEDRVAVAFEDLTSEVFVASALNERYRGLVRSQKMAAVLMTVLLVAAAVALTTDQSPSPRESRVSVGNTSLYSREVGRGQPIIVLHGGPDFDTGYLLPDMDRLADGYRLIYYDQRGRGKSADGVRPDDVTLASEIDDLDKVREHFQLNSFAVLGHSWGAVLALEYALRHPARVSRLILMNPAPVSASDVSLLRRVYARQLGGDMDRQREIIAAAAYQAGDPEAVTARYRLHFKHALDRPADYEKLMTAMHAGFVSQGSQGIVKARAVEDRLYVDTWNVDGYDLLPRLRELRIPTLVISGEHDFIPPEIAARIARAIPGARLEMIRNCGHFAYLERPQDVRRALDQFLRRPA